MSVDTIVGLIFGAGGIGSVGGFIKYRDWARKSKLAQVDTEITRLIEENKRARTRADEAEASEDAMRKELNRVRDKAALYRGMLIQANLLKVDLDDD